MTTAESSIVAVQPADQKLVDGMTSFLATRENLQALADEQAKKDAMKAKLLAAAQEFDDAMLNLTRDQRNRLLLQEDIKRYRAHRNYVSQSGGENEPLWLLTAARAAGVMVKKIELRPIEALSPCEGRVVNVSDTEVSIEPTPVDGKKAKIVDLPRYGGKVTVAVGDMVHQNTRVIMPLGATHAIVKGPRFNPLIVGFATKDESGNVTKVLVEGRGKSGYFTLLADGLEPRFRFGHMVRGFDRLNRLVGGGLAFSAMLPVSSLRDAADAAYGPCPQLPGKNVDVDADVSPEDVSQPA